MFFPKNKENKLHQYSITNFVQFYDISKTRLTVCHCFVPSIGLQVSITGLKAEVDFSSHYTIKLLAWLQNILDLMGASHIYGISSSFSIWVRLQTIPLTFTILQPPPPPKKSNDLDRIAGRMGNSTTITTSDN